MTKITVKQFGAVMFDLYSPVDPLLFTESSNGGATAATLPLSATSRFLVEGTHLSYNASDELVGGTVTKIIYQTRPAGGEFRTQLVATGLEFDVAAARTARLADQSYPVAFNPVWDYDARPLEVSASDYGLVFTAAGGNDRFFATGGRDVFIGFGGKDTVSGGGGVDQLDGGAGNDHLSGGKGHDSLAAGGGSDTIDGGDGSDWYLAASFSKMATSTTRIKVDLAAGKATGLGTDTLVNIENAFGSEGNDTMLGNGGNNNFIALGGNDSIGGGGGKDKLLGHLGVDTIAGGTGKDQFVFMATGPADADRIKDFSVADDTIVLHASVFTALAPGALAATSFVKGKEAKDADDHVIYHKASGKLWYDADGTGAQSKALIATFENNPSLTAADIKIVALSEAFWI